MFFCELVVASVLKEPLQAHKIAQKRVSYLKGTMNLEQQEPDGRLTNSKTR